MNEKPEPVGVTRPHVDYEATGLASYELSDDEVVAEHPPEHVLDTLRTWMNFE